MNDPFRETSPIQNQSHVSPPNSPVPASPPVSNNVTVEVSGSRFCIIPSLFSHIESLPWKRNRETLRLHVDPDVFEMILQYFMFSSLPDYHALTHQKATELLELIKPLGPSSVQRLVEYVEHYIVNNAETTSCIVRKRFSSFSSMSSRNNSNISRRSGSASNDDNKALISFPRESNVMTKIPSHIRTSENKKTQPSPPFPAVDNQSSFHSTKSFLTSLLRSDSSSSDGSISKLSQPSFSMGGLPGQDENCMSQSFEVSLGEQDQQLLKVGAYTHDNADVLQSSYPQRVEQFEFTGSYRKIAQTSPITQTSTKTLNNATKATGKQEEPQILGESKKQLSMSDVPRKTHPSNSKKLFRKVFQTNKGDRGQRKMTHADWCSSEYIL
jgi:hypothetical protein